MSAAVFMEAVKIINPLPLEQQAKVITGLVNGLTPEHIKTLTGEDQKTLYAAADRIAVEILLNNNGYAP